MLFIVKVIKHMLIQQCFNRVYFTKHLTKKVQKTQSIDQFAWYDKKIFSWARQVNSI